MAPESQAPFEASDTPPLEFSRATRNLSCFVGRMLHEANDASLALKALALSIACDRTATPDQVSFVSAHVTRHAIELAHAGKLQESAGTYRLGELLTHLAKDIQQQRVTAAVDARLGRVDH